MAPRVKKNLKDLGEVKAELAPDVEVAKVRVKTRKPLIPEVADFLKKQFATSEAVERLEKMRQEIIADQRNNSVQFKHAREQLQLAIDAQRKLIYEAFESPQFRHARSLKTGGALKLFDQDADTEKKRLLANATHKAELEWTPVLNACKITYNVLASQYQDCFAHLSDARKEVNDIVQ